METSASKSSGPPSMTAQQRLAAKYAAQAADTGKRRPLHHSPLFWGGVVLFLGAIGVYVFTDALAWMPLRGG